MSAKVHQITHRHHEEIGLNLYTRRLDKIYEKIGKSPMLPKAVKKMRGEYLLNPHEFYLKVCKKYGMTPEKKIDAYRLIYGNVEFGKDGIKRDKSKRDNAKSWSKGAVREVKEEELPVTEQEWEKWKSEPSKKDHRFKFNSQDRSERRSFPHNARSYTARSFKNSYYPENDHSYPRLNSIGHYQTFSREKDRSSPQSLHRYVRSLPPFSRRQALGTPQEGSPRALYRIDDRPVELLDYVNVEPGNIVETMIMTGDKDDEETGLWLPARILKIDQDKETMDVQVLQPEKYGLATKAVGVPYRYVRRRANVIWDTMSTV